ncbi:MAG: hypothetical protein JST89_12325 [Cyanobacteria bacterium SZAS-4]|nr:hypothetical protein [Cyanobacteria bacterium SZAS-4]
MSASSTIDLSTWVEKLKSARNRNELFAMLDSFRVLEWTDEQRASIAKLYMRLIDVLPHDESAASDDTGKSGGPTKPAEQEEVWYEKM